MKIKKLEISNWRSIKAISLEIQDLAIFIGQNNNGKSNILNSLLFFFGELKHSEQDFNDPNVELFVEVTFCCLDDYDKTQFNKYVSPLTGEIRVRKTGHRGGLTEYRGYAESPVDEKLREENMSNYITIEKRKELAFADKLPTGGKITVDTVKAELKNYLEANRTTIPVNYQLEANQFMGAKSIAQSLFGEVLYIPAVTVAANEVMAKGGSMFNKLYSKVASKISETNPLYKEAAEALTNLVNSMNRSNPDGSVNVNRPEELQRLEELIANELVSWKSKLEIEFKVPHVDDAVKLDTSVMIHDGTKTDIDRKGNGLQRSLVFALIKSWAIIIREEREKRRIEEGENTFTRGASHSTYFIFEEPELFLHPQAQRELFTSLRGLSEAENQVFLTTHSSSFIDLNDHKSIVIVHKNDFTEGTTIVQCNEELYLDQKQKSLFNLQLWFNPERNEAFFAKKVILFEGNTEKVVIPYLAKKLGIHRYDYTLLEAGSKESIPLYIHMLNCFGIKYVVICDKDEHVHKAQQALDVARESTLAIERKVDFNLGHSIFFENDIEEELKLISVGGKQKPFKALECISEVSYIIPFQLETKLRLIYA